MDRPDYLPKELDKETIKWLRDFGFTLNINDERYKRIKNNLKKWYEYEYYFYVDEDIKKEAEKIFIEEDQTTREFYKTYGRRFRAEKRRLIKKLYGLEKKGIR